MGGRSAAGKRVRAQAPAARIGFIGGGNMATALIRGFVAAGLYRPDQIVVSDVDAGKRAAMTRRLKVAAVADNAAVVRAAPVLVLAVKPQIMGAVLDQLRAGMTPRHLVVSIAAGWPTGRLERAALLGRRRREIEGLGHRFRLLAQPALSRSRCVARSLSTLGWATIRI